MKKVQALIRFELTLRGPELRRLELDEPHAWSAERSRQLMQQWIDRAFSATGVVPNINGIHQLPRSTQVKLRAYLLGDTTAFSTSPTKLPENRRAVLATIGIDITSPLTWQQQRNAVETVREVLIFAVFNLILSDTLASYQLPR